MANEFVLKTLDEAPLNRKHILVTVLSALGSFIDGYDLFIISVALLQIVPHFQLNPVQTGMLGSSLLIGSFIGSTIFGGLADKLGRRAIYLFDLVVFIIFAILCAIVGTWWQLLIFRFVMGIGIGADMPTSTVLIAESSPRKHRGKLTQSMVVFWFIGGLVAGLVGLLLLSIGGDNAWRWMLGTAIIPPIILLLLRRSVPETPRWLAERKNEEEVQKAAKDLGVSIDSKSISTGKSKVEVSLLKQPYFSRMLLLSIGWLLLGIPATGAFLYTPTILHTIGFTSKTASVEYSIISFVVYVCTALVVSLWLMEKWGRRKVLIIMAAISALSWLTLAFVGASGNAVLITALVTIAGASNLGCGSAFWVLSSEVFPTSIRGAGSGAVIAGGRFGGVISTYIFPPIIAAFGIHGTSIALTVLLIVVVFFGMIFKLETAGVSLESLSQSKNLSM